MPPKDETDVDLDKSSTVYQHLVPSSSQDFTFSNDAVDKPPEMLPESLFRIKKTSLFGTFIALLYSAAAIVTLIWSYSGAAIPDGKRRRVFRTPSNLKVDQFYSSTAIAALLTPAAIVLRLLSNDFGRMHPFALSARTPVRMGDLDRMMDFGAWSLGTLSRYSKWIAIYQGLLMATGALLVPLGSLTVTTGLYAPKTHGHGVVGMPIAFEGPPGLPPAWVGNMSATMGYQAGKTYEKPFVPSYDDGDVFLSMVNDAAQGAVIGQTGFSSIKTQSAELGPISTGNISFKTGVQYNGIVTFEWDAGCVSAANDISYTIGYANSGNKYVNVTWPDGTMNSTADLAIALPKSLTWNNGTTKSSAGIPVGGTTFFATESMLGDYMVAALPKASNDSSEVVYDNGTWISRTKCTPRLSWQISSCVFDGHIMTNCTKDDESSMPVLDTVGLDNLEGYVTATVWTMAHSTGVPLMRAILSLSTTPGQEQVGWLFGVIAKAAVSVATAGYFGTATVETVGEPANLVYIARTGPMIAVTVLLTAVALTSVTHVLLSKMHHSPMRRITFLSIASATQSPWWARQLRGESLMNEHALTKRHTAEVMFGGDGEGNGYFGLIPAEKSIELRPRWHLMS
jgi:hypothetical protein